MAPYMRDICCGVVGLVAMKDSRVGSCGNSELSIVLYTSGAFVMNSCRSRWFKLKTIACDCMYICCTLNEIICSRFVASAVPAADYFAT